MAQRRGTIHSPIKQKALLLLLGGVVLAFSRSPAAPRRIWKALAKDWKSINRDYLYRLMDEFYYNRLIDYRERDDGTIDIVISEAGRQKALAFKIDEMVIDKPSRWDGYWRLVSFDIPERLQNARRALREKLLDLGFKELQKSVLIFPYPCEDEVNFIVEFFDVRRYVHYIEAKRLSNDSHLKLYFKLY